MRKRNVANNQGEDAKRDPARRVAMEFGVAADSYRSEPSKKASRNGAVGFRCLVFVLVFAATLGLCYPLFGTLSIYTALAASAAAFCAYLSVHIALEWESVIILRLGRFSRVEGPGIFLTIPFVESCALCVDQRMMVTPFGAEETLTSDLVPLDVDAVLLWMIWNPELACTEVEDCHFAVALAAQTALRDAIGRAAISEVVTRRNQLDSELREAIEKKVSSWGVTIVAVEVRDVIVPQGLQDQLSLEAQSERRRNSRIMLMEAERDISDVLSEVSEKYRNDEIALELRRMHLVGESMRDNDGSIVIPSSYAEGFVSDAVGRTSE